MIAAAKIYILTIDYNELTIDVCINIIDLFDKSKVGYRFKRMVLLQVLVAQLDRAIAS